MLEIFKLLNSSKLRRDSTYGLLLNTFLLCVTTLIFFLCDLDKYLIVGVEANVSPKLTLWIR
jgi:hypothetical protein